MSAVTISKYGADLGDQLGAVKPHVRDAAQTIADKFGLTEMSGYRAGNSRDLAGHPAGLAVDVPAGRAAGDAIAAYATANASALGIKYVIWQQRIWYPGKEWAPMAARSGAGDQNHLRHVHISFNEAPPGAGLLEQLRSGVTGAAGVVSNLNPLSAWPEQATGVAFKVAGVLAGLGLVLLGANRLVAPAIKSTVDKTLEAVT